MLKLKNILVPVDFSKEAKLALDWAVRLARENTNATLTLLHVIMPVPLAERGVDIGAIIDAEVKTARRQINQWRAKIPASFSTVTLIEIGDPVQRIASTCKDKNIDLVVMTTGGRQGVSRFVHPNLTEKVVRIAPCPVMALHLNSKSKAPPAKVRV